MRGDATAGVPSLRQAAVLFVAFGVLAGGAFAGVAGGSWTEVWILLFLFTVSIAAGALALLVFRVWRRHQGEAWPSLEQCLLLAVAGAVLTVGGCGGWGVLVEAGVPAAIGAPLGVVLVLGLAVVLGAVELFLVVVFRRISEKLGAR